MYKSSWMQAAFDYVDTGDDTALRVLVQKTREADEEDRIANEISRDQLAFAVKEYEAGMAARVATHYPAATKVIVRSPYPESRYWSRHEVSAEAKEWHARHVRHQSGMGKYIPKEYACSSMSCGLIAKWEHDGGQWCERHSKIHVAERASRTAVAAHKERWDAMGRGRSGYLRSEDVIAAAR